MHIHNKFEVTLKELVAETKKKGGKPKSLTVDPKEAWGILNEMRAAGRGNGSFELTFAGIDRIVPYQTIYRGAGEFTAEEANDLIKQWIRGEYGVLYDGIPINVKVPPKKPDVPDVTVQAPDFEIPPKPEGPANETIPWWRFW